MSTLLNYYDIGTVTVAHNSTAVTGTATLWAANIRSGDILWIGGTDCRVDTVTDNSNLVLAFPWPGADESGASYEIRLPPPSADITVTLRALMESLSTGLLDAVNNLSWSNGDIFQWVAGVPNNSSPATIVSTLAPVWQFPTGGASTPALNFGGTTGLSAATSTGSLVASVNGTRIASFNSTGLGVRSTGAAHDLVITSSEALTSDRILSVVMNDANRTLSLAGNLTIAGAFALTLTQTGATNVTLPTTGTLATLAGAETLTNKTFNASNNTLTNLTAAMFAANVFDTDGTLSANSSTRIPAQSAVKSYIDAAVTGVFWKHEADARTTGALAANTYNNGTSGVGATLTGNANGALAAQDGVTLSTGQYLLVLNEVAGANNGLYTVTQVGDGSHPYILTRSTDSDTGTEMQGAAVFVKAGGTLYGSTQWVNSNSTTPTMGTTAITFGQMAGAGTYSAGTGIDLTGNVFSIHATQSLTSLALGGATIGSDALGVTGTATISGSVSFGGGLNLTSSSVSVANGIGKSGTNILALYANSTNIFQFNGGGAFAGHSGGWSLPNAAASATVPTLVPNQNDNTTGLGSSASGTLNLVAGGTNVAAITSAGMAALLALGIRSSGAAFDLQIKNTETLTANRALTITLNDAARTVNLAGNVTLAGAFTTAGAFALTLTQTAATNVTLPTTGTLSTLAGAETLTNKVFNASNNTVSNIDTTMFVTNVIDNDAALAAASATRIATQQAVKSYVDNRVNGLSWKPAVAVVAVSPITLSGEQTIDSVLTSSSRVLVTAQASAANNGIYVSSSGAWSRATDAATGPELAWATVLVEQGTIFKGSSWTVSNQTINLGVDNITIVQTSNGNGGSLIYTKTDYSATAGQVTFSAAYTIGYVDVWKNGVKLSPTEYTASNGTTVVLGTACEASDILEIIAWNVTSITTPAFTVPVSFLDGGSWGSGGIVNLSKIAIGMSSATNIVDITQNQNSTSTVALLNNSSGGSALSRLRAANGSNTMDIGQLGQGYTTNGILQGGAGYIQSTGGMAIFSGSNLEFAVNGSTAEIARFDTSGRLLINCTSTRDGGMIEIHKSLNAADGIVIVDNSDTAGASFHRFFNTGSLLGSITNNSNTGTAYNTTSDERLKNDWRDPSFDEVKDRMKAIYVGEHSWIKNPKAGRHINFKAQQGYQHHPQAFAAPRKPDEPWLRSVGEMEPLHHLAIQQLYDKIEILETELAQLKRGA